MTSWRFLVFLCIGVLLVATACAGPVQAPAGAKVAPGAAAPVQAGSTQPVAAAPADKIVLKFSHVTEPNTPKGIAAQAFAERVKERLKGRVEVEVYPSASLFNDGQELQALAEGKVDILAPAIGKLPIAEAQVFDLFFLVNHKNLEQAINGEFGRLLAESVRPLGYKMIGFMHAGTRHFTNSVRPLKTPADFKGLKFRIQKSPALAGAFALLGAETTALPLGETVKAMESGAVQGGENSLSNIYTQGMHKVQKYLTISNHAILAYAVIVNAERWNQIPADIRTELEKIMAEVSAENRKLVARMDEETLARLKGTMAVYELTEAERAAIQKQLEPLYNQWEEKVGKAFMAAAREGK